MFTRRKFLRLMAHAGLTIGMFPTIFSCAEWVRRDARHSYRGPWNRAVHRELPELFIEFNGINFGHALIAETLLDTNNPGTLEEARQNILAFIFSRPKVPPDEEQIAPNFSRLVWKLQKTFNWAHTLHSDLYDLFAYDNLQNKISAYKEILANYLNTPEAITTHQLDLHDKLWNFSESRSFATIYTKLNSQIWVYHWFQAKIAEMQMQGGIPVQRELSHRIIDEYHAHLRNPPAWGFMPMFEEIAPTFSKRFPEAATIFNNLHMLHDNIDDILSRHDLYRTHEEKRLAILSVLEIYLHGNHANSVSRDRYGKYRKPSGGHEYPHMHHERKEGIEEQ